jgi:hypothetical protein
LSDIDPWEKIERCVESEPGKKSESLKLKGTKEIIIKNIFLTGKQDAQKKSGSWK